MPKLHAHAPAITALVERAGSAAILAAAAKVPSARRRPPRPQVISMWKRRGVPWAMREMFRRLAAKHGVRLPRGFHNAETVYT